MRRYRLDVDYITYLRVHCLAQEKKMSVKETTRKLIDTMIKLIDLLEKK